MNKKILLITTSARTLLCFRYHLMKDFVDKGYTVIACAAVDQGAEDVVTRLNKINVKFVPIKFRNTSLNFFYDLKTIYELFSLIRKEKPDLVLSYISKAVIYGSVTAKLAKVKSIYSMITGLGYIFTGATFKNKILKFIVRRMYALALRFNKKVFFQNPDDLNLFIENKIINRSKGVLINGSGVDISYYTYTPVPKQCVFLLIARLLKDKGVYEYIEASKQLKQRYPFVKFRLVGNFYNNPSAISKTEVEGWVNEGVVEYLDFLDNVKPVLENCSVFVLPSFYREGTPRSTLEAMATGRPIITTNAPGCRETVNDGINGYLVPIKDVDSLIVAMEKFILAPKLIEKMGQASRCMAEEKYDIRKVNKTILEVIGI